MQANGPPLYLGGSLVASNKVAATHVDTYLTLGDPPATVEAKIREARALADAGGRTVSVGIRPHVIACHADAKAWEAAEDRIRDRDGETIAAAPKVLGRLDSVGQARMSALHAGQRDRLDISPNLWAGVDLVRGGAGTALVGSGETAAQRIRDNARLGIDSFILSGSPHLGEACGVAEVVLPRLTVNRGVGAGKRTVDTGLFGETIAHAYRPATRGAQS